MTRDAFALARVAERIGLVTGTPLRLLFISVFVLPVLGALVAFAVLDGRRRLAGAAAALCGAVGLVGAGVVLDVGGRLDLGPVLALPLALFAIASGVSLIVRRSGT